MALTVCLSAYTVTSGVAVHAVAREGYLTIRPSPQANLATFLMSQAKEVAQVSDLNDLYANDWPACVIGVLQPVVKSVFPALKLDQLESWAEMLRRLKSNVKPLCKAAIMDMSTIGNPNPNSRVRDRISFRVGLIFITLTLRNVDDGSCQLQSPSCGAARRHENEQAAHNRMCHKWTRL
jgi:hypothetical protein